MTKWHPKDLLDLSLFRRDRKIALDQADHRRHGKARHGLMCRQNAQNPHRIFRQPNLFARLAQSSGGDVRVALFLFAAGKGDLARVMFQMARAFGQQDLRHAINHLYRHQYPRRTQLASLRQHDSRVQIEIRRARGLPRQSRKQRRERIAHCSAALRAFSASSPTVFGSSW